MTAQACSTDEELMAHVLAAGGSVRRAAKTANVSESTVYRRRREPDFLARVTEIRTGAMDEVLGRITTETLDACDTLHRLLGSPSEAIQLRAAKTLIELALKFHARDRHAGSFMPTELAQTEPDHLAAPAAENLRPSVPESARPDPLTPPPSVTPPQAVAVQHEVPVVRPNDARASATAPVSSSCQNGSTQERRRADAAPTLLATGTDDGPGTSRRALSNPVKAGHRPAARPPVNEMNRLSAGLTIALDRVGSE